MIQLAKILNTNPLIDNKGNLTAEGKKYFDANKSKVGSYISSGASMQQWGDAHGYTREAISAAFAGQKKI